MSVMRIMVPVSIVPFIRTIIILRMSMVSMTEMMSIRSIMSMRVIMVSRVSFSVVICTRAGTSKGTPSVSHVMSSWMVPLMEVSSPSVTWVSSSMSMPSSHVMSSWMVPLMEVSSPSGGYTSYHTP